MDLFNNATDKVAEAIKYDKEKKYDMASIAYKESLQMFLIVLKYERNVKTKELLQYRINQYLARAEEIEKLLSKPIKVAENGVDDDTSEDSIKKALRSSMVDLNGRYTWKDVAGLEKAKASLREAVELPIKFPSFYSKRTPWKGILLFGCPGNGKTFLGKVVASIAGASFFSVSSSDIMSKWVGDSEKSIKYLFELARESSPSIIFIDEIDSLCSSRNDGESESSRRIKTTLLTEMDGLGKENEKILVMGATNLPWSLDTAFRRRFQKRIYIPLPDIHARKSMIRDLLSNVDHVLTPEDIKEVAELTEGYSGSDIKILIDDAIMEPVRSTQNAKQFIKLEDDMWFPCVNYPNCSKCPVNLSNEPSDGKVCDKCGAVCVDIFSIDGDMIKLPDMTFENILMSLSNTPKTVSKEDVVKYEIWAKEFGQDGA